jgi:NAD(P)-dependent dehydrogenase (short-subunit alcohol dehydrogenase family)
MDLQGKTAFVTGAAGGIGRASALAFGRAGANVAILDINVAGLNETAGMLRDLGVEVESLDADISSNDAVERATAATIARFGRIDCAHNNAGVIVPPQHFSETSIDAFRRVMDVNLFGVLHCMKAQLPRMEAAGGGVIVNTASVSGFITQHGNGPYVTSKHAVIGLTRAAALDYGPRNIRINAVCPGFVETPLTAQFFEGNPEGRQQIVDQHAIGRICQPEDIANVVVWLCSDKASYLLGACVVADGGFSLV